MDVKKNQLHYFRMFSSLTITRRAERVCLLIIVCSRVCVIFAFGGGGLNILPLLQCNAQYFHLVLL